jgi:iron complex outermembrane receptor protein
LSGEVENRFYLTLDRTDRDLPGGLTKSKMGSMPSHANKLATVQDWNKNWSYIRLADKLSIRTEEIQFDAGAFWFHRDLENRGFFSSDFRQGIEMFYSDNFGGTLNFVSRHQLFGRRNIFTIGLSPQYEIEHTQNYENLFGYTGATTARGEGISLNVPAYFEDQFYLGPQLSVLAGTQAIFAERHFIDDFFSDAQSNQSHLQDFFGFSPKIGAIYEIDRDTQLFTATTASREFLSTSMRRNCSTKVRLVFMPARTCIVTSRGIRSIRRTHSLPTVMRFLVSTWDFDGATDSQFFWIART